MRYFEDRPLLMMSQSANDLCLSLLVLPGDDESLLRAAHDALIPDRAEGVFGDTWQRLSACTGDGEAAAR
jgi:hypothetical protein